MATAPWMPTRPRVAVNVAPPMPGATASKPGARTAALAVTSTRPSPHSRACRDTVGPERGGGDYGNGHEQRVEREIRAARCVCERRSDDESDRAEVPAHRASFGAE